MLASEVGQADEARVLGRKSRRGDCGCGCGGECAELEVSAATVPTPGRYYSIQQGKGGLLVTTGKAYGLGAGAERLKLAQAINNHPENRKFWVKPSNDFERRNFPNGIISFNPRFTCGTDQRTSRSGEKRCFAKIFIPARGAPAGQRRAEDNSCGVPTRPASRELELELELEGSGTRRAVTVRPRLCLFQNHSTSTHRNHFQCGATRQARRIAAIASPRAGTCVRRVGATPYDTGADIIAAIAAARQCLGDRAVDAVHVFSHGFRSGITGTTSGSEGLYQDAYPVVDRADGGRTVSDVPVAALANNVRFVLHGCNIGSGTDNFARSLYQHLAGTLSNPRVYAHRSGGCAGRNRSWREYSNAHPTGRNLSTLADIASTGCCSA
jgi:hypothetical protein